MTRSEIAVVIPVRNRRRTVLKVLEGVKSQSTPPGRLIVIDDGSEDGTTGSVQRWLSRQDGLLFPVELVHQSFSGAGAARNHGLARSGDCEFVAFLDSDDIWPRDFLKRTQQHLVDAPLAAACSCDRLVVNFTSDEIVIQSLDRLPKDPTRWLFHNHGGIGSVTLFRAEFVRRAGGYDEAIPTGQDLELFLRLSRAGPWLHCPGAPVTCQMGQSDNRSEETNLSLAYRDGHKRWAEILERFYCEAGPGVLDHDLASRRLSRMWYCAGRDAMRDGEMDLAKKWLHRSTHWRQTNVKAWFRLLRVYAATQALI